jgi:hypothetical protein
MFDDEGSAAKQDDAEYEAARKRAGKKAKGRKVRLDNKLAEEAKTPEELAEEQRIRDKELAIELARQQALEEANAVHRKDRFLCIGGFDGEAEGEPGKGFGRNRMADAFDWVGGKWEVARHAKCKRYKGGGVVLEFPPPEVEKDEKDPDDSSEEDSEDEDAAPSKNIIKLVAVCGQRDTKRYGEAYDPDTNLWVPLPRRPPELFNVKRSAAGCCNWNGKMAIAGGTDDSHHFECLDDVEIFDPMLPKEKEWMRWVRLPAMSVKRAACAAVCFDGRLVVIGGRDGKNRHRSVEWFDDRPTAGSLGKWVKLPDMNFRRAGCVACVVQYEDRTIEKDKATGKSKWVWTGKMKSKIVVAGGTNNFSCQRTAEYWGWGDETWTRLPDMMTERTFAGASVLKGPTEVSGSGPIEVMPVITPPGEGEGDGVLVVAADGEAPADPEAAAEAEAEAAAARAAAVAEAAELYVPGYKPDLMLVAGGRDHLFGYQCDIEIFRFLTVEEANTEASTEASPADDTAGDTANDGGAAAAGEEKSVEETAEVEKPKPKKGKKAKKEVEIQVIASRRSKWPKGVWSNKEENWNTKGPWVPDMPRPREGCFAVTFPWPEYDEDDGEEMPLLEAAKDTDAWKRMPKKKRKLGNAKDREARKARVAAVKKIKEDEEKAVLELREVAEKEGVLEWIEKLGLLSAAGGAAGAEGEATGGGTGAADGAAAGDGMKAIEAAPVEGAEGAEKSAGDAGDEASTPGGAAGTKGAGEKKEDEKKEGEKGAGEGAGEEAGEGKVDEGKATEEEGGGGEKEGAKEGEEGAQAVEEEAKAKEAEETEAKAKEAKEAEAKEAEAKAKEAEAKAKETKEAEAKAKEAKEAATEIEPEVKDAEGEEGGPADAVAAAAALGAEGAAATEGAAGAEGEGTVGEGTEATALVVVKEEEVELPPPISELAAKLEAVHEVELIEGGMEDKEQRKKVLALLQKAAKVARGEVIEEEAGAEGADGENKEGGEGAEEGAVVGTEEAGPAKKLTFKEKMAAKADAMKKKAMAKADELKKKAEAKAKELKDKKAGGKGGAKEKEKTKEAEPPGEKEKMEEID